MKNQPNRSFCLLIDNGSLVPASTKNLRKIAAGLTSRLDELVLPVSLSHSDAISPEELDGIPARKLVSEIARIASMGGNDFLLIPLFFGRSAALTHTLPLKLEELKAQYPEIRLRLAPPLAGNEQESVPTIAEMMNDLVQKCINENHLKSPSIVVLDHGSPVKEVTEVRNQIAESLASRFPGLVMPASMERREGDEYLFNEPLLASALEALAVDKTVSQIVLSMLFFSPGRHAGPCGDIEQICQRAKEKNPYLEIYVTELLSAHAGLVDLLKERHEQALLAKPL